MLLYNLALVLSFLILEAEFVEGIYKSRGTWEYKYEHLGEDAQLEVTFHPIHKLMIFHILENITGRFVYLESLHTPFNPPDLACEIPLDLKGHLNVRSFDSGDIVINENSSDTRFVLINISEMNCSSIVFDHVRAFNDVLIYNNTFDVVSYNTNNTTDVFRYDSRGNLIDKYENLQLPVNNTSGHLTVTSGSTYRKYLLVEKIHYDHKNSQKSRIIVFNSDFKHERTIDLPYDVILHSTGHDKYSFCYKGKSELHCKYFDSEFKETTKKSEVAHFYTNDAHNKILNLLGPHETLAIITVRPQQKKNIYDVYFTYGNGQSSSSKLQFDDISMAEKRVELFEMDPKNVRYCVVVLSSNVISGKCLGDY